MINKEQAYNIANEYLSKGTTQVQIVDDDTMTTEFGWVFFYQSTEYLETKDDRFLLGGNAPLIVDKENGQLIVTGTRLDTEVYIELYKKYRNDVDKFNEMKRSYVP